MFFIELIKSLFCFTGSYSNDCFLEPLTTEEENKCIEGKLKGDVSCRNKLIEHNLRLVAHIVKKYDKDGTFSDDLISIGTIGLIKGVDTYKDNKNVRITTYCARCIENEILMYFRKNNKYNKDVSINDSLGFDKDGNNIMIQDVLKGEEVDFCNEIELKDNIKLLYKYMDVLTKRERDILCSRYGLNNKSSLTQKKISKILGISRSYVSRIEKRALAKLYREFLKNNKI